MASVNKAIVLGNLGKDPDVRYAPNGDAVCNISIATTEKWKNKDGEKQEKTEWHRIVFFGKLAEIAGEYLKKGSQCYVEGRIQTRSYDKDGTKVYTTEIVGEKLQLLGSPGGRSSDDVDAPAKPAGRKPPPGKAAAAREPELGDVEDIPF